MTRSELIEKIAKENPHLYRTDAERIVSTIFDEISKSLTEGNRVELRGFGVFSVRTRKPRKARNPKTGASVMVDQKSVPFFKAGKLLKKRINSSDK